MGKGKSKANAEKSDSLAQMISLAIDVIMRLLAMAVYVMCYETIA